jgi:hypothetical protein
MEGPASISQRASGEVRDAGDRERDPLPEPHGLSQDVLFEEAIVHGLCHVVTVSPVARFARLEIIAKADHAFGVGGFGLVVTGEATDVILRRLTRGGPATRPGPKPLRQAS